MQPNRQLIIDFFTLLILAGTLEESLEDILGKARIRAAIIKDRIKAQD